MVNTKYIALLLTLAALGTVVFVFRPHSPAVSAQIADTLTNKATLLPPAGPNQFGLIEPVAQFRDRITKKNFGMYITPDTSPVADDHFTGYHTGVDAEFTDTSADIPVFAIADGTIVLAKWINGYGGLIVIRHTINGVSMYALYGHLDETSFPSAETTTVARGDQIAVLGEDHSYETDGVRKHIHFAISTGETIDYRGYVPTKAELENWMNPLNLF